MNAADVALVQVPLVQSLGRRCESLMRFKAAAVSVGDYEFAAQIAERAKAVSAMAFRLAGEDFGEGTAWCDCCCATVFVVDRHYCSACGDRVA